jgi:hypothetical protein
MDWIFKPWMCPVPQITQKVISIEKIREHFHPLKFVVSPAALGLELRALRLPGRRSTA